MVEIVRARLKMKEWGSRTGVLTDKGGLASWWVSGSGEGGGDEGLDRWEWLSKRSGGRLVFELDFLAQEKAMEFMEFVSRDGLGAHMN